jgi:hypothetical protein
MAADREDSSVAPESASRHAANLAIYLQLISAHDRGEYILANGREPIPVSRILIRFDDEANLHESGFYMPDDGELPRVFIHRRGFVDEGDYRTLDVARSASDPLRELLWFAHELGHHHVVLRGLGTGVRDDERPAESYAEEVLAWTLARHVLHATAFSEWDEFERVAEDSLKSYEAGFKLNQLAALEIRRRAEAQLANAG